MILNPKLRSVLFDWPHRPSKLYLMMQNSPPPHPQNVSNDGSAPSQPHTRRNLLNRGNIKLKKLSTTLKTFLVCYIKKSISKQFYICVVK